MKRVSGCLSYLLSRLGLIGGTFRPGSPVTASRTAGRTLHACLLASAVRVFISPTAFEQARGGALGAGGCQIGYLQGATSHLYI